MGRRGPLTALMKEITFIRNNIEKWQQAEAVVEDDFFHSPADLADAYEDVTADLAFAQTHYPLSQVTLYLNNLASALHNEIYRNKREKWSRLITFWTGEVPLVMYRERKALLVSFLIFLISTGIGIVSQLADPELCRVILGDSYVDMTLHNIEKGTPMAVYDGGSAPMMFLEITFNNIGVSFFTFVSGLLTSFATGLYIFQNAVMMGCFETFFYQHHLLGTSLLAVFLHGTLELSSIIVAGAAGLVMGNGWLFPGTYPRLESFKRGAKRGMKIVVGTVPLFVIAGFIEGFFTRYTQAPVALRLGVIICSLAFVVFYFIVYPVKLHRNANRKTKN